MESQDKQAENTVKEVRGVPFKKGEDERRNTAGRPKGALGFNTLYEKAIKRIAEENKIDLEEPELRLILKGFNEAMKGNFSFWTAIVDRRFGKIKEQLELSGGLTLNEENKKKISDALEKL